MVAVSRSQGSPSIISGAIGRRSKVWDYFKQVIVNGVAKAECLDDSCKMQLLTPNMSTSSLRRHLHNVHNLNEFKSTTNNVLKNQRKKLPVHVKKQLDQLIIEAVVRDARCFTDFDKPGLKKFLQFALPEYKPPHRHTIQRNIKRLHVVYFKSMIDSLSNISYIAITTDFWSDKKQNSYLVLTGHYVDDQFIQKTTVLKFSTFSKRHYSPVIGREIEKQLTELGIFDKVTTITCDGAPNMVGLFDYLSRTDIDRIQCMAHKIHLIICNGLGIWLKQVTVIQENSTNIVDIDEHLSQTVRTIKIHEDIEDEQENNADDQEQESSEEFNQDDNESGSTTKDNSKNDSQGDEDDSEDDEDDDEEESDLEDNFQHGVNTEDDDDILPIEIDRKVGDFLFLCRGLSMLKTTEITSIERELKQIVIDNNIQKLYTHHVTSTSNTKAGTTDSSSGTITKRLSKNSTIDDFLESITDPVDQSSRSTKSTTTTGLLIEEFRNYKLFAARYVLDGESDSLLFWRTNQNFLPLLSALAKKYLASPASSVASEAAFSVSANYGRKQRARLLPENLALSVYLHDKFDDI
ncbi:unnamed protein product [Rotaria sp. Silwood2]|nr:unnamed protein product [Rotaria sp. Silwood2]CAF4137101.1 unnamed protein product [Rotaria sp. Silwood2]